MDIQKIILDYKPNIKESSVKSYRDTIKTMIDHFNNEKFYTDYNGTMKYINSFKLTTGKNKLSSLVVLLKALNVNNILIEKYSDELKRMSDEYNNFNKLQTKTKTQTDNWIEYDDLLNVADDLLKQFNKIVKQDKITNDEYKILVYTVMIHTHLYIPLRNDLSTVKRISEDDYIKNGINTDDNYIINHNKIIMNDYKTNKIYGQLIYKLPVKLSNLYNKYFKFNKSPYLITSVKDRKSPITRNTYTKYFNSLFSLYYPLKKISSSMIRHIIASHDLKNRLTIKQQNEEEININKKFQHSGYMNNLYRKL